RVDLFDLRVGELPGLVTRPMTGSVPRHLSTVATALTHTGPLMTSATVATLRLLHACLEHRFRFDIEIGDAAPLVAGDYDISLSDPEPLRPPRTLETQSLEGPSRPPVPRRGLRPPRPVKGDA